MGDINRGGANKIDSSNSTTTTLTANSTFTGAWTDVLEFAHITVQVRSSHDSASAGLNIQWSSDGSNIDDSDSFKVVADTGKIFTFGPQARYMRIVYTNGASNQTSFRLQTILKIFTQKASSHRINSSIMTEDDAELVKAVISAEDNTGVFKNLRSDSAGRLLISSDVATPADTTEVNKTDQSTTNTVVDLLYTITNGKILTLQILQAGAESNNIGGSKVTLFEDPNGNLSVLNLITVLYVNGSSAEASLSVTYVGDGTRRIVMRRAALAGASREIFGRWKGFEQ